LSEDITVGAITKTYGLDGLGVPEKVDLINELWEEVISSTEAIPISDELGMELEPRLAAYKVNPSSAVSPEELRSRLQERLG